jgi:hypothetical protein
MTPQSAQKGETRCLPTLNSKKQEKLHLSKNKLRTAKVLRYVVALPKHIPNNNFYHFDTVRYRDPCTVNTYLTEIQYLKPHHFENITRRIVRAVYV